MMKLHTLCVAALLVLASAGAGAVDLSEEEGALLRERASVLKAQRDRNPAWDGGTRYSNDAQFEARPQRARASDTPSVKRKREPVKSIGRAARSLPGALVRGR
jgi:hypothetical protein